MCLQKYFNILKTIGTWFGRKIILEYNTWLSVPCSVVNILAFMFIFTFPFAIVSKLDCMVLRGCKRSDNFSDFLLCESLDGAISLLWNQKLSYIFLVIVVDCVFKRKQLVFWVLFLKLLLFFFSLRLCNIDVLIESN